MEALRAPGIAGYSGPERRARVTYVTRNTEYHVHRGICVAVRDKASGRWLLRHAALRRPVSGVVRTPGVDSPLPSEESTGTVQVQVQVQVGDVLFFAKDGPEVVTTTLTAIDRPRPSTVEGYPV